MQAGTQLSEIGAGAGDNLLGLVPPITAFRRPQVAVGRTARGEVAHRTADVNLRKKDQLGPALCSSERSSCALEPIARVSLHPRRPAAKPCPERKGLVIFPAKLEVQEHKINANLKSTEGTVPQRDPNPHSQSEISSVIEA